MPTYEYRCTACAHRFEAFQSMSDDPLTDCPECGKKVKRVIGGGTGIIFKGSGFYVNDSKKTGSSALPAASASASPAKSDLPVKKDASPQKEVAPKKEAV